jgi:toxin ParE1/3/4
MRLRYTTDALAHLEAIYDYLFERNPAAARRIAADIHAAAQRICLFPYMGRKGDAPGTHEWVVQGTPYLFVYEVDETRGEIVVLAILHGAQDWQRQPE